MVVGHTGCSHNLQPPPDLAAEAVSLYVHCPRAVGHYTADMDISRVELPSVCQRAADKALDVVRLWWSGAAYLYPKERNLFEPFGEGSLHVDPEHVWSTPGDSGGGETQYDVDTRAERFWEAQGGRMAYQGRDMHIMSPINLRINGKHVWRSADRLARTADIPAVRGGGGAQSGPGSVVEGLPVCGIFQPARATTTKCALFAHLFLGTHWGAECC